MKNLAYLAGVFDGEGTVIIARQGGIGAHVHAAVGMMDPRIPRMFYERWGGSFYERGNGTGMWAWQVTGEPAAKFLREIRPYLVTKAKQAWLALEYLAQRTIRQGRLTMEERALREGYVLAIHNAKKMYD